MSLLTRFLAARSRSFVVFASALLVVLLSILDYLSGTELRLFLFYWAPVAAVTWYAGSRWGNAFVLLTGLAWLLANTPEYLQNNDSKTLVWNGLVNVVSFALLARLIARLRLVVDRERATARTDFTTGVPNPRAFKEIFEIELARSRRTSTPFTIACLDLDDFKLVNDRRGHSAGDDLLRAVAGTVRARLRASDTVARLGGDEFAVLLPGAGAQTAATVLGRLEHALAQLARERNWPVSASIGAITTVAGAPHADELIGRADALMYEAISAGKGNLKHVVDLDPAAPNT